MNQALGRRQGFKNVKGKVLSSRLWTWESVRGPIGPSRRGGQRSGPQPLASRPLKDQDFVSTSCSVTKPPWRPLVQKIPTPGPGRSQDSAALGGKVSPERASCLAPRPHWGSNTRLSAPVREPSLIPLSFQSLLFKCSLLYCLHLCPLPQPPEGSQAHSKCQMCTEQMDSNV